MWKEWTLSLLLITAATTNATATPTQVQETAPATQDPNGQTALPVYQTWSLEPYMDLASIYGGYITAFGLWGTTIGAAYTWRLAQTAVS